VSLYRVAWRLWGQVAIQLGPGWVRVRFAALVVVEQVPSPLAMGKDEIMGRDRQKGEVRTVGESEKPRTRHMTGGPRVKKKS
jgi:hypothetical protein